jgi:glyoxylase-like metal-dependent hydrolase (beta-lactamase superfamily II)
MSLSVSSSGPASREVGGWRITPLVDGSMRLDGGAMWGVVPKPMWEKLTPPDADNSIAIAIRPFLAERGEHKVLVECGLGDRWDEKWRRIYRIETKPSLVESLASLGVAPEAITHVVATHCHWDHFGAAVARNGDELVPRFPRARYFAPRIEIENARRPDHVRRASYRPEDVEPLLAAGVLEAYDGDVELLPGLHAHVLGGHSDGVAVITLGDEATSDCAIFWSDVVPTTHHAQPAYIMAFDIDVARSFRVRSEWLARAAERGWLGLFYHDTDRAFAKLARDGKRYTAV